MGLCEFVFEGLRKKNLLLTDLGGSEKKVAQKPTKCCFLVSLVLLVAPAWKFKKNQNNIFFEKWIRCLCSFPFLFFLFSLRMLSLSKKNLCKYRRNFWKNKGFLVFSKECQMIWENRKTLKCVFFFIWPRN